MLTRHIARPRSLCLLLAGVGATGLLIALLATGAEATRSPTPAADCQPFTRSSCLLPFPARQQKSDFLQATGSVVDVCAGKPCHTYDYTP